MKIFCAKFKKIICFLLLFVILIHNIIYPHLFEDNDLKKIGFDYFCDLISLGNANYNNKLVALNLHSRNNLLVGCSPVVYCARFGGNDLLVQYDYDTIGFGSTLDSDIIIWMDKLKKNDYDRIVMWGTVNDIMYLVINGVTHLYPDFKAILDTVVKKLKEHTRKGCKIIYVIPKEMTYGVDNSYPEKRYSASDIVTLNNFINNYNTLAREVTDYMRLKGFYCVTVDAPTTKEYSEWYVHYNNKVVFEDLFKKISKIK